MEALVQGFQEHEKRIANLERVYQSLDSKIELTRTTIESKVQSVETGQMRIEKTLIEEGQGNRDLLKRILSHQFKLSDKKLTIKEKVTIAFITTVGSMVGGGGLILVIQYILGR